MRIIGGAGFGGLLLFPRRGTAQSTLRAVELVRDCLPKVKRTTTVAHLVCHNAGLDQSGDRTMMLRCFFFLSPPSPPLGAARLGVGSLVFNSLPYRYTVHLALSRAE